MGKWQKHSLPFALGRRLGEEATLTPYNLCIRLYTHQFYAVGRTLSAPLGATENSGHTHLLRGASAANGGSVMACRNGRKNANSFDAELRTQVRDPMSVLAQRHPRIENGGREL